MKLPPFHAYYKARTLSNYKAGSDKFLSVFASSDIAIYPFQIAAASFALRSPYLKGAVLCDEGSLGKTYEALLIINQLWYEGKKNILIVVPAPLLAQWQEIIEQHFSIPYVSISNSDDFVNLQKAGHETPFDFEGILLTSYSFATEQSAYLKEIPWELAVFDEAHHLRHLYKEENSHSLKKAVGNAFKLLLTATPMQLSILDLYGLIHFIDENILPNEKDFYERYFRKPENYSELAERVSKYCFRTTKMQAESYVKIPLRLPLTITYNLSAKEEKLYDLVEHYVGKAKRMAFPKMEPYDLSLLLFRTLSSSTFALQKTLSGVLKRLKSLQKTEDTPALTAELQEVTAMYQLAESITKNAKAGELLTVLKAGFAQLKQVGANKKALIFTENKETQRYLYNLLNSGAYKGKVLSYSGDNSRDYSIMKQFEETIQVLITTDLAAEGFNLEFCSFIINYDLPYNTLLLEQRINRCHRQGQESDVLAVTFLNQKNFADVRMLELINKRTLQFDGILGLSDYVVGNFITNEENQLEMLLETLRPKKEIEASFQQVLETFETENKVLVTQAEQSLYTTFNEEIAKSVTVTPQYIKDKTSEINNDLWALTTFFFDGKQGYHCNDKTRTVKIDIQPQKVFTGAHLGRREYSMTDKTLPSSGRHTLTGTLARNILNEIFWRGVPDRGTIQVESTVPPCKIGYYTVKVKPKSSIFGGYSSHVFVGKTAGGQTLSHEECLAIMALPVLSFTTSGETYGERDGLSKKKSHDELDDLIVPDDYIKKFLAETASAEQEEIQRMRHQLADQKAGLNRKLDSLRTELKNTKTKLEQVETRLEKLQLQKQLSTLERDLKKGEENLFMAGLALELAHEQAVEKLIGSAQLLTTIKRQFIIQVN